MGMNIYSNYRERTRVLRNFVHFIHKRQEAREELEGKLVEGKNLRA